ncbi:hypothetical protein [Lactobacillus delbrueckii]|uniref:hypothetical protein n=1 Tax=Lactobacillus delbrueckii TaxID=1584 RepID=UPI0037C99B5D
MAKIKGANAVLDVMYKWGIDHLYGFPGGSFDSTMNAIYEMQDKVKFIEEVTSDPNTQNQTTEPQTS